VATWSSNGHDTGGAGSYNPGTQGVQYIHDNFAAAGDTIILPTGTFIWSTGVTISKSVTIQGSGYTPNTSTGGTSPGAPTLSTTLQYGPASATIWLINNSNVSHPRTSNVFRITGIHFINLPGNNNFGYIQIGVDNTSDQYRLDNCIFDGAGNSLVMVTIYGTTGSGVMDHCTLIGGAGSEMIHYSGTGAGNLAGWFSDVVPGGPDMNFVEDCISQMFNYNTQTGQTGTKLALSAYGARYVVRYCLMNFTLIDLHGNLDVNARWIEFYNNQIFIPSTNTGNTIVTQIRGGSGVIYNISLAPGCQTTNSIICTHWTDEASTNNLSPAVTGPQPGYGPGAGIFTGSNTSQGPSSSPLYYWNLDSHIVLNHVPGQNGWDVLALNVNYYQSTTQPSSMIISQKASQIGGTTYNYSPFTYPHPLTGLSTSPGNGLTAVADSAITKTVLGVTSGAYTTPTNNYVALYNTQFTSSSKAGGTEWTSSSDGSYARQAMGATGTGWTIAAYANGTGVIWKNSNPINFPAVTLNAQTLYAIGFCDALTAGNINFFVDLANNGQLSVPIGISVVFPALTGAVFTTY
jgi:hypothetical protein